MDSTAKLSDIITSLQNMEGINQKADLKSALIAKGISALDTDSMATLISKVNSSLYGSAIKRIQRGAVILPNTSLSIDIALPYSVDLSKAICRITYIAEGTSSNFNSITCMLTSITNLQLLRTVSGSTYGGNYTIHWEVIEFSSIIKSLQTGSFSLNVSTEQGVAINTTNVNKSMLFYSFNNTASSNNTTYDYVDGYINSSTDIKFKTNNPNLVNFIIKWQLIEFN